MKDAELVTEILKNCALRYVNTNSQNDIDRSIDLATRILIEELIKRDNERINKIKVILSTN